MDRDSSKGGQTGQRVAENEGTRERGTNKLIDRVVERVPSYDRSLDDFGEEIRQIDGSRGDGLITLENRSTSVSRERLGQRCVTKRVC